MSVILAQCPYALTNKFFTHTSVRQGLIAQIIPDETQAVPEFLILVLCCSLSFSFCVFVSLSWAVFSLITLINAD